MIGKEIKNVYLTTNFSKLRIHSDSKRNNELHDLTIRVIKLIFPPFGGTGSFLIGYANGHTK